MLLHALQVMHIMVTFEMFKWYTLLYTGKSRHLLDGPRILIFKANILALLVYFTKYGILMCIEYVVIMWL